jgi:phosphatidylglycerol---prolipoprotein diacylglyceryl transferase
VYPYLLEIGPLTIASFGTMVAIGFLTALLIIKKDFARKGLDPEVGSSLITAAMVGGLVGAKLYFVVFEMPPTSSWSQLAAGIFSGSGLTWYGGFIVAFASVVWTIRRHGVPLWSAADSCGMALAAGYAIGRIGCQLAGDGDYGMPTDLPWAMAYPDGVVPTLEKVHPAPVYETLLGGGIFALLWAMRRRPWPVGLIFSLYLVLSGAARFSVEIIRINPKVVAGLSGAQVISLVLITLGLIGAARLIGGKRTPFGLDFGSKETVPTER